jgi:hypothetical protein
MRRSFSTLAVVCLLLVGPIVSAQPREDPPLLSRDTIRRVVRIILKHLLPLDAGGGLAPPIP